MNTAALVYDVGGSYDAFARYRVSEPQTIFDCKLLYDKQPFFWDDAQTSGSGTDSIFNAHQASVTLTVSANTAGTRVRQTYQRFAYQPGKSQLTMVTGVLGSPVSGVTKRLGYFDGSNGLFFQVGPGSTDVYIGKRTFVTGSPVDTLIPQSQWNKNKLINGDDITLDITKSQVYYFNYEWLGVGDIFCGVALGGKYIPLHQFYIANTSTTVSMSIPNLPIRYEISNNGSGGSASLVCICSAVMSEGGQENIGYLFSINRGASSLSISSSSLIYPILSVRLRPGITGVNLYLETINIITTSNNVVFKWTIHLNPTFTGTALTWTTFNNQQFQYNNTADTNTTISGGTILYSGYGVGTQASISISNQIAAKLSLGTSIAGVSDIITLGIERLDNQTNTFYASMNVRESI